MNSTFTSCLQTPYLLITDADTFFMRDLGALDLMEQEACTEASGVCDLQKKVGPSVFMCKGKGEKLELLPCGAAFLPGIIMSSHMS